MIIILSFDIAPLPYKHTQRRITFHARYRSIVYEMATANRSRAVQISHKLFYKVTIVAKIPRIA